MASSTRSGDDQAIARSIRRGRYRGALELLARSYGDRLGRLCFAIVQDQARAEELVQEIFIAAYRALPGFEGRASIKTWLYTIARRTCSREVARQTRRGRILARADVRLPSPRDPQQQLERLDQRRRLSRALADLTDSQREVLLLRFVGDLSFREVARVCEIREAAARQRASSGLRQLRRLLAAESFVIDPGRVAAACQELPS